MLSMTRATPIDMCMCGEALLQAGRLNNAEKWFKKALAADPSLNSARVGLLNVAARRKMTVSADAASNVAQPADEPTEKEMVATVPRTTFELGKVHAEGSETAYSTTTTVAQGTHSLASETARQLRVSTTGQQVALAVSSQPRLVANHSSGNNQVLNAWAGYKGVQKH